MGILEVEDEGLMDGIGGLGHKGDDITGLGEALEGGILTVDQHHSDLAVVHRFLAANDDGVAVLIIQSFCGERRGGNQRILPLLSLRQKTLLLEGQ